MSPVCSVLISDIHIHLPFGRNVHVGHNMDKIVFNEQNLFMYNIKNPPAILNIYMKM